MAGVTGRTLVDVSADRARATPDAVAFRTKLGTAWTTITYSELAVRTREVANGLISLGVAPGSSVSLLSKNRAEWILSDLAILSAGARSAPLLLRARATPRAMRRLSPGCARPSEDRSRLDVRLWECSRGTAEQAYPAVLGFDQ